MSSASVQPLSLNGHERHAQQYNVLMDIYTRVQPGVTCRNDIKTMGLDLEGGSNGVTRLGPTEIRKTFMEGMLISADELPGGVRECVKSNECVGYDIHQRGHTQTGKGSMASRWFNFHRVDIIREWNIQFIFLMNMNDVIVYKEMTVAMPYLAYIKEKKNPLGPLQNVFGKGVTYKPQW